MNVLVPGDVWLILTEEWCIWMLSYVPYSGCRNPSLFGRCRPFLQSWHINLYIPDCVYLYIPDCMYLSVVKFVRYKCLWIVLFVRSAILRLVCLKSFVMAEVSFPTYVNVHHFLCGSHVWVFPVCVGGLFRVGFGAGFHLWVHVGNWLLCKMLFIMLTSCSYCFVWLVSVQSIIQESYSRVFMLGWVVGVIWNNGVRMCRFLEYWYVDVCVWFLWIVISR
jgi:hypothetical protein